MTRQSARRRSCQQLLAATSVCLMLLPAWVGCEDAMLAGELESLEVSEPTFSSEPANPSEALSKATIRDVELVMDELVQPGALDDQASDITVGEVSGEGDPNGDAPAIPCLVPLQTLTQECVQAIYAAAVNCVPQIGERFQNGNPVAAQELAAQCKEQINQSAAQCLTQLRTLCQTCLNELQENEAPTEAIHALLRACSRAGDLILRGRRGAVGAIDDAVDRGIVLTCIRNVRQATATCAQQNGEIAQTCTAQIAELLNNGQPAEAFELAQQCVQQVQHLTSTCVSQIHEHCQTCLQALVRNCADGYQVRLVRNACENALHLVIQSGRQAANQIRDSLPEPPSGEPS